LEEWQSQSLILSHQCHILPSLVATVFSNVIRRLHGQFDNASVKLRVT